MTIEELRDSIVSGNSVRAQQLFVDLERKTGSACFLWNKRSGVIPSDTSLLDYMVSHQRTLLLRFALPKIFQYLKNHPKERPFDMNTLDCFLDALCDSPTSNLESFQFLMSLYPPGYRQRQSGEKNWTEFITELILTYFPVFPKAIKLDLFKFLYREMDACQQGDFWKNHFLPNIDIFFEICEDSEVRGWMGPHVCSENSNIVLGKLIADFCLSKPLLSEKSLCLFEMCFECIPPNEDTTLWDKGFKFFLQEQDDINQVENIEFQEHLDNFFYHLAAQPTILLNIFKRLTLEQKRCFFIQRSPERWSCLFSIYQIMIEKRRNESNKVIMECIREQLKEFSQDDLRMLCKRCSWEQIYIFDLIRSAYDFETLLIFREKLGDEEFFDEIFRSFRTGNVYDEMLEQLDSIPLNLMKSFFEILKKRIGQNPEYFFRYLMWITLCLVIDPKPYYIEFGLMILLKSGIPQQQEEKRIASDFLMLVVQNRKLGFQVACDFFKNPKGLEMICNLPNPEMPGTVFFECLFDCRDFHPLMMDIFNDQKSYLQVCFLYGKMVCVLPQYFKIYMAEDLFDKILEQICHSRDAILGFALSLQVVAEFSKGTLCRTRLEKIYGKLCQFLSDSEESFPMIECEELWKIIKKMPLVLCRKIWPVFLNGCFQSPESLKNAMRVVQFLQVKQEFIPEAACIQEACTSILKVFKNHLNRLLMEFAQAKFPKYPIIPDKMLLDFVILMRADRSDISKKMKEVLPENFFNVLYILFDSVRIVSTQNGVFATSYLDIESNESTCSPVPELLFFLQYHYFYNAAFDINIERWFDILKRLYLFLGDKTKLFLCEKTILERCVLKSFEAMRHCEYFKSQEHIQEKEIDLFLFLNGNDEATRSYAKENLFKMAMEDSSIILDLLRLNLGRYDLERLAVISKDGEALVSLCLRLYPGNCFSQFIFLITHSFQVTSRNDIFILGIRDCLYSCRGSFILMFSLEMQCIQYLKDNFVKGSQNILENPVWKHVINLLLQEGVCFCLPIEIALLCLSNETDFLDDDLLARKDLRAHTAQDIAQKILPLMVISPEQIKRYLKQIKEDSSQVARKVVWDTIQRMREYKILLELLKTPVKKSWVSFHKTPQEKLLQIFLELETISKELKPECQEDLFSENTGGSSFTSELTGKCSEDTMHRSPSRSSRGSVAYFEGVRWTNPSNDSPFILTLDDGIHTDQMLSTEMIEFRH